MANMRREGKNRNRVENNHLQIRLTPRSANDTVDMEKSPKGDSDNFRGFSVLRNFVDMEKSPKGDSDEACVNLSSIIA